MANILIIMLGKGHSELMENQQLSYRSARYVLPDTETPVVETPFLGEAILKLYAEAQFERVIILGTQDSMWDTLLAHCTEADAQAPEGLARLHQNIKDGIGPDIAQLALVAAAFSRKVAVPTQCQLIPVGRNHAELWHIFETLTHLPNDGDTVSIDLTHGLRFQPFMLVLAMAYFKSVRQDIQMGQVFYGALELSKRYFKELSPIFDLSPMLELLDWLQAAQAFRSYGDIRPIAEILKRFPEARQFIKAATAFSRNWQYNEIQHLRPSAVQFLQKLTPLAALETPALYPLKLVSPSMMRFPRQLSSCFSDWEIMLQSAQAHLNNHGQTGLAVLACWEAVIARLAEIYRVEPRVMQHYTRLSQIACLKRWSRYTEGRLKEFPKHALQLRDYRHAIAHLKRPDDFDAAKLELEFPLILAYMKVFLRDTELLRLPKWVKFNR